MAQKRLVFTPESLLALLTHYTDGLVPLDTVCRTVEVSEFTERMIGMSCDSAQWTNASEAKDDADSLSPLHIRYEGKRVMSWGDRHVEPTWSDAPDAPSPR